MFSKYNNPSKKRKRKKQPYDVRVINEADAYMRFEWNKQRSEEIEERKKQEEKKC